MSVAQQSIHRKKLNSKQAHTTEAKGKERKAVTLVQIDRKSEFALDDNVAKKFCRVQKDYLWILNNRSSLTCKFPNKYIAVADQTVRFSADTAKSLMMEIAENQERVDDFAIEFLNTQPRSLLF